MPDENLGNSTAKKPGQPTSQKKVSNRWHRRRRWIWTLAILIALCYLINGPLTRWLVLYGVNKGFEKQGMMGKAEISGTLLHGMSIKNLFYTGDQGLQSLMVKEVAINYNITEIFKGRLRSAILENADIIIDIDKFPARTKEPEEAQKNLRKTLKTLHTWISQPEITISDLDIQILKSGEKHMHFLLSQLRHRADSNNFTITEFKVTDKEQRSTPIQNVNILWEPEAIAIDRFEILPDIVVKNTAFDWSTQLKGQGKLEFLGAIIDIKAADKITATLTEGTINSEKVSQRFDLNLPATIQLAAMDISIGNWEQPIPKWNTEAKLHLTSTSYQNYHIVDTDISIEQDSLNYDLKITGARNDTPLTTEISGRWSSPHAKEWWGHTSAKYKIHIPKTGTLAKLIKNLPQGIKLEDSSITANGNLNLHEGILTEAIVKSQITNVSANNVLTPAFTLDARYQENGKTEAQFIAKKNDTTVLKLDAKYHLESQNYEGSLKLTESSPGWLNALAKIFQVGVSLKGPTTLSWSGKGHAKDLTNTKKLQIGKLNINQLQIKLPKKPALTIEANLNYRWPESITLPSLSITSEDWHGTGNLRWNGQHIDIIELKLKEDGKELTHVHGKIPFNQNINSIQKFLAQTSSWNLNIQTEPLTFSKLNQWLKNDTLKNISGTTHLDIQLNGSPAQPEIKGSISANKLKASDKANLQPLQLSVNFYTENENFLINANLLEENNERILINSSIPFTPSQWINDPNLAETFLNNTPIEAEVKINTLPLSRFKGFIPELETIEGTVNGKATLGGTLNKPKYVVDLDADVPLIRLKKSELGDIRNIKLNTKLTENQKANTKLTAQINGGEFEAGGTIDLSNWKDPAFDLYLRTQYALIHRDDTVSIRTNSNLKLVGKMEDATLSGSVGIAESLFYKDIELIPIGVPSSEVAKVNLPALSKKKADDRLPIPKPFADWKLNVKVFTEDPVLIRGNIARGNLTGSVKVNGTFTKPTPLGTISVNKVKAKLPFSILEIAKGEIKFTPENGLDPTLNIRGKSTINSHDVSLFIHGQASSPKTTFTSNPPLPETEVITLIATGTTTSDLGNRSVATFKAFQIFLLKLQQRNDKPDGNKLFKALLSGVDDLNLNVGETDPFTGRQFTSGTITLHPQWNLTAQVDDTQETRGLIVYVIKFR